MIPVQNFAHKTQRLTNQSLLFANLLPPAIFGATNSLIDVYNNSALLLSDHRSKTMRTRSSFVAALQLLLCVFLSMRKCQVEAKHSMMMSNKWMNSSPWYSGYGKWKGMGMSMSMGGYGKGGSNKTNEPGRVCIMSTRTTHLTNFCIGKSQERGIHTGKEKATTKVKVSLCSSRKVLLLLPRARLSHTPPDLQDRLPPLLPDLPRGHLLHVRPDPQHPDRLVRRRCHRRLVPQVLRQLRSPLEPQRLVPQVCRQPRSPLVPPHQLPLHSQRLPCNQLSFADLRRLKTTTSNFLWFQITAKV